MDWFGWSKNCVCTSVRDCKRNCVLMLQFDVHFSSNIKVVDITILSDVIEKTIILLPWFRMTIQCILSVPLHMFPHLLFMFLFFCFRHDCWISLSHNFIKKSHVLWNKCSSFKDLNLVLPSVFNCINCLYNIHIQSMSKSMETEMNNEWNIFFHQNNPVAFLLHPVFHWLKQIFWYDVKLCYCISFNIHHILKPCIWDENVTQNLVGVYLLKGNIIYIWR